MAGGFFIEPIKNQHQVNYIYVFDFMNKNPVPPESLLRWDINDFGWRVKFNNKHNYERIKQKGLSEESKSLADIEKKE